MIKITGPSTGSSLMTIEREPHHQRFIIRLTTDFGEANGVFGDADAAAIATAINSLLPPPPPVLNDMQLEAVQAFEDYLNETNALDIKV